MNIKKITLGTLIPLASIGGVMPIIACSQKKDRSINEQIVDLFNRLAPLYERIIGLTIDISELGLEDDHSLIKEIKELDKNVLAFLNNIVGEEAYKAIKEVLEKKTDKSLVAEIAKILEQINIPNPQEKLDQLTNFEKRLTDLKDKVVKQKEIMDLIKENKKIKDEAEKEKEELLKEINKQKEINARKDIEINALKERIIELLKENEQTEKLNEQLNGLISFLKNQILGLEDKIRKLIENDVEKEKQIQEFKDQIIE